MYTYTRGHENNTNCNHLHALRYAQLTIMCYPNEVVHREEEKTVEYILVKQNFILNEMRVNKHDTKNKRWDNPNPEETI